MHVVSPFYQIVKYALVVDYLNINNVTTKNEQEKMKFFISKKKALSTLPKNVGKAKFKDFPTFSCSISTLLTLPF
ncbi:hypothetical protein D5F52_21625 [Brevibacillus laterosporus]|nr:hypothetical protein BrL25_09320 [Brevibacillus laterosporus DSM 25]AYB40626.1 hypothetical protein D5F52_21625 [Brevibacillus laterosporus]MBG9776020.1 hypothetical protein [Brevibacillus laterosporus]MBG9800830.1 hypothetical protein [Brevibacillus laterosporus]TPH19520.1 hypothetical protein EGH09_06815 [Brevibacillus laterosporus]